MEPLILTLFSTLRSDKKVVVPETINLLFNVVIPLIFNGPLIFKAESKFTVPLTYKSDKILVLLFNIVVPLIYNFELIDDEPTILASPIISNA